MVNFFGSDHICPKWIKLDQIWSFFRIPSLFPKFSTFYKFSIIFTNLLALDNKISNLFLIRFDQICPKRIKLDQIWISHLSKNVDIKICHIYHENNYGQLFLTRSDEICPKWIKMDQTWSNLDFSPIKKCWYRKLSHLSWE